MLNVLADAEDLAREAKLFLGGGPGADLGAGCVGAEEVPGVEAGKVLDCAEEFVAAGGGGDEAEVVGYGGVVGEGVGDHGGVLFCAGWCSRPSFVCCLVCVSLMCGIVSMVRVACCFVWDAKYEIDEIENEVCLRRAHAEVSLMN